ncbi:DUF1642 domain-containing protein [Streptococcus sp.]
MNKVYIEGYEVGFSVDTIGNREEKIQVASGEIVSIDKNFIYKSIETEKVKIPQFVADFIAKQKKLGHTLSYSIDASMSDIVAEWYWDNSELFALAWILGYEVEKEKRYLVKVKGIDTNFNFLNRHRNENYWIFSSIDENTLYQTRHTRKQLEEADFGWVFDCPGIEIEEVEYDTNA